MSTVRVPHVYLLLGPPSYVQAASPILMSRSGDGAYVKVGEVTAEGRELLAAACLRYNEWRNEKETEDETE